VCLLALLALRVPAAASLPARQPARPRRQHVNLLDPGTRHHIASHCIASHRHASASIACLPARLPPTALSSAPLPRP
jgi:hypothetical protein